MPRLMPPLPARPAARSTRPDFIRLIPALLATLCFLPPPAALAAPAGSPISSNDTASTESPGLIDSDLFALHAQSTFVWQGNDGFHAPYSGSQSLGRSARGAETWDLTLYAGLHPWKGSEIWVNGEVDQGFGIGNTLGIAGFPSGEAYKIGRATPYFRIQRAFWRQTINLGGPQELENADLDLFSEPQSENRLVITAGKFAVTDLYDSNSYAHDPRADFLNWSVIDTGTYDYAADSWGYSAGAVVEWYQGRWTLRSGGFLMSEVPNSPDLDTSFHQFQIDEELEERHTIGGKPGKIIVTAFVSHARMADLATATRLAKQTGQAADDALVRHFANRPGISLTVEQTLTRDLAAFLRAGWSDGRYEAYEFTDIDRTLAGGLSLDGTRWQRARDHIGLAGVVNVASRQEKAYLAAGGTGLLAGDGKLPHPGAEHITELYYDVAIRALGHITLDYQWIGNPAYNRDRGPVSVFAIRLHAQI
ncbi:carbohydrate porin [Acetobacter oeni]|nr:carbohydrate porin [Acetobacter oeni]MBB3882762.1 high affinity Mn2+ porin [Acetobacter oeni]NHO18855.1 carbohydrate porin [Acetobacter oeni]